MKKLKNCTLALLLVLVLSSNLIGMEAMASERVETNPVESVSEADEESTSEEPDTDESEMTSNDDEAEETMTSEKEETTEAGTTSVEEAAPEEVESAEAESSEAEKGAEEKAVFDEEETTETGTTSAEEAAPEEMRSAEAKSSDAEEAPIVEEPVEEESTETAPAMATGSYVVKVGETMRIPLGATTLTGKVTKSTWSSSDSRIVRITAQDPLSCTVTGVSTDYGTSATITCNYVYYIGGTYIRSSWSGQVPVQSSGGSGSSGGGGGSTYTNVAIIFSPQTLTLDLAKDRQGKKVSFSFSKPLDSRYKITFDPYTSHPAVSFSSTEYRIGNGWPVYTDMWCKIYPQKVGTEKIQFWTARRDVIDGEERFFNANNGYGTLSVDVICTHEFDEGVRKKAATETTNEIRECTCKYCGTKQLKEILPASTKVNLTNVASGIKVSWDKVKGAKYYKVYRGDTFLFSTSQLYGTDTAVKTNNGSKYTYKVYASTTKNANGDSTKYRTCTGYRLIPVGIKSLKNSSASKMTVTYDKNSASSGYVIRYGLKSDMSDAKVITVKGANTLSRTIGGLKNGKTYYVQVRTYKLVNDTRFYSGYCTTKTVKITK